MTTDFCALCYELHAALEKHNLSLADEQLLDRSAVALRAALSQPEPEGPTDEELDELAWNWYSKTGSTWYQIAAFRAFARAALARWGRSDGPAVPNGREPASVSAEPSGPIPADGEVAELATAEMVRQLRTKAATEKANRCHYSAKLLTRAADLLEQYQAAPVPVAVSERLPEPGVKVLAHYFNDLGKGRTICAIWVPAKTRSDSYGDDDFTEYDEESDTFYWPEGWYEAIENWDDLGYVKVDEGEVIYWEPLPKWPAHALPVPNNTSRSI